MKKLKIYFLYVSRVQVTNHKEHIFLFFSNLVKIYLFRFIYLFKRVFIYLFVLESKRECSGDE